MKHLYILIFLGISQIYSFAKISSPQTQVDIEIEMLPNGNENSKSSSSGSNLLEYNGYRLFEVLSLICDIPLENFELQGDLKNPLVRLKVESSKKLNKRDLINSLFETLRSKFNLRLALSHSKKKIHVLYNKSTNSKAANTCDSNIVTSNITIVNRTFKARCITIDKLTQQIEEWYGIQLLNDFDRTGLYNFEIHHANSLSELIKELNFYYALDIKEETREVQTLLITK